MDRSIPTRRWARLIQVGVLIFNSKRFLDLALKHQIEWVSDEPLSHRIEHPSVARSQSVLRVREDFEERARCGIDLGSDLVRRFTRRVLRL
jgi:hypothetical protein